MRAQEFCSYNTISPLAQEYHKEKNALSWERKGIVCNMKLLQLFTHSQWIQAASLKNATQVQKVETFEAM